MAQKYITRTININEHEVILYDDASGQTLTSTVMTPLSAEDYTKYIRKNGNTVLLESGDTYNLVKVKSTTEISQKYRVTVDAFMDIAEAVTD